MSPPDSNPAQNDIPIAVVGLSCRFPGEASSPSKFWDLLRNGKSAFSETTKRFNADAFYHPGNRQNVVPTKGGYLLEEDPYAFDAAFFNITAAEAIALDPRQRIAMEVAYEALENAAMPLAQVAGTQTACFMGSSMSDYRDAVARDFAHAPRYHILGISDEMISNRISHFLDIHGPSATVQTACSSSLVATHLACQSLRSGESDMAIAGGVGLILSPDSTMHLNNLGFLSPAGQSRSFDENANGYGRGEGCGILVLKCLDQAVRDGDTIRAVIRATGVNSDGWTQGVTMPSGDAQAALIKYVYESNGLDYGSTQYVEAHGTGTKAGDPIETDAIRRTIVQGAHGGGEGNKTQQSRAGKKLWIGSVKPNIGHLEAAAGVASIIKGVLALEHGLIPPNINFYKLNPSIPLDQWNMAVPTKLTPWPAVQQKRMSISGFGMGGTNAHVVLDAVLEAPAAALRSSSNGVMPSKTAGERLFVFSSHDKAGFKRIGHSLANHLDTLGSAATGPDYLANLAHTLAAARSGLSWKSTCLAENVVDLREQLLTALGENAARVPSTEPRIGFIFTGQGAQWARMGIELLERRVFRESVARSAAYLTEMGSSWDPITELSRAPKESRLGLPEISQPICSVLQIALVDELRSWGIRPSKVTGHSSGEIAAAYTIGALSHRDAIAVAYFRGKASAGLKHRSGGMMAVGCSRTEAQKLMAETNLQATVACVNSPSNVTISGDVATLETLQSTLVGRGVFARRLKVDVAYHSSHMNSCSSEYYAAIEDLATRAPEFDQEHHQERPPVMVSSVTGSEADPELLGPYYWIRNLISPVLFTDAVKELVCPENAAPQEQEQQSTAVDVLVEIGPHSALGGPIEQILSHHSIRDVVYLSVLTRGQSALDTSLHLAAELFRSGVALHVPNVNGDANCRLLTNLPPYPWNHSEHFRAESRMQREFVAQKFPTRSLLGAPLPMMDESERIWRSFVRLDDEPWLRDHTVGATVVLPGAGIVSLVLEAAQQVVEPGKTPHAFRLRDVSFVAPIALSEGNVATEITVHMRPHLNATSGSTPAAWWEFTVSSCAESEGQLRLNCRGLATIIYEENKSSDMAYEEASTNAIRITDYHRVVSECPQACPKEVFYDRMAKSALPYGAIFQGVESCHPGPGKTAYQVKVVEIGETFTKGKLERPFLIHGATLDAVFQGWLGSTCSDKDSVDFGLGKPLLPKAIGELEISVHVPAAVGDVMPGFCTSQRHSFNEFSANIHMFDEDLSKVLVSVTDLRTAEVEVDDTGNLDGDGGVVDIDPAEITSEVHWNYALDLMKPAEIGQVVLGAAAMNSTDKMIELVRLAIHQHPAVDVIELAGTLEELSHTIMSRLPRGSILPSHIRYAVINNQHDQDAAMDVNGEIFGRPISLGSLDAPLSTDIAPADLFVVPHHLSNNSNNDLSRIFDRLSSLAKPSALFAIASASNNEEFAPPAMKAKGFECISYIPSGAEWAGLYSYGSQGETKPETYTNGTRRQEVSIVEPTTSSEQTQLFSNQLQNELKAQGYSVSIEKLIAGAGVEEAIQGKTYISLLEMEQPLLDKLSEVEYRSLHAWMLKCGRLLWITYGDNPSLGIVDGLARCINGEVAGARFQVFHLSSNGLEHGPALAVRVLAAPENRSTAVDNEYREQGGLLQVSRVYTSPEHNSDLRNHLEDSTRVISLRSNGDKDENRTDYRLTIGKPGLLDTLHFVSDERAAVHLLPLGDDEVEFQVKATGVNFRDIMASMGLVPVKGLGQEASGIVLRTGSRATRFFKPGDRVSALSTGGTHTTKTRCDYRAIAKMPDTMSFEEAAASPMAHATAYYALVKLAKLCRGQSVLIHAAAGGVGQAAVQLARHLGLMIYVTVGTQDKRRFLVEEYGLPEEHIFNSRDSSFVQGVQRVTKGRGVDCVLNSLSGELLRVSWGCLATFGTFVEIGLRDITDNMRLDMRPFVKSTTFTFFNIQTLIDEDPALLGETLSEVFQLLQGGILSAPRPMTVYSVGQVEEAFRIMQQGRHRGKLVLSFADKQLEAGAPVLCKARQSLKLDPNATYLLVGGLGGLGRSLALDLIAAGCRNIAFVSRSGDSRPEAKVIVDELAARGAQVKVFRSDVADATSFNKAMEQCSTQLPPIKGVFQMAMVLRDTLFENMGFEDWEAGLKPKVQGTWNLHRYFDHKRPLDFMIFFSSISGVCGNPGQAQYAAGNSYQDALASFRRAQGLKAISVNLGIMLDVGVIAETGAHNFKTWEDTLGIREPAFHALMRSLINSQQGDHRAQGKQGSLSAQLCTGLGTADILAARGLPNPLWFQDARFGPLAVPSASSHTAGGESNTSGGASLAVKLGEAGGRKDLVAAAEIITDALVRKTADILRIPPSEVDSSRAMYHYGVDSLVALEVRNWIMRELKANMALLDILAAVPMKTFGAQIAQKSKLVVGVA